MPKEQFTCAMCEQIFDKGWTDEEAKAELDQTFGVPQDECEVVCDDCYRKLGL